MRKNIYLFLLLTGMILSFCLEAVKAHSITCKISNKNSEDSLSVLIFMSESCVICQYYTLPLRTLMDGYQPLGIKFVGIFPNSYSTDSSIRVFRKAFKIPFDLVKDTNQVLTKRFGATITPEVVVIRNQDSSVIYRGRIDNTYVRIGKKRTVTTSYELEETLEFLTQKRGNLPKTQPPIGCFIHVK